MGVKTHFPEAHHLYCVIHILRNIFTKDVSIFQFWQAVEATSREEFEDARRKLPSSSKFASLMEEADHWSRFAVREKECQRYGIRTNNNSESQNNALTTQRTGTLLDVLISVMKCTSRKVSLYRNTAARYKNTRTNPHTPYAVTVFLSNFKFAVRCRVEQRSSTEWRVSEGNMLFVVTAPIHCTFSYRRRAESTVHLTEAGFTEIKHFCENARALGVDVMEYALSCISKSDMKFYCQIPFDISSEPCVVIDLRSEREVVRQLRDFIVSGEADDSWISPS